MLCHVVPYCSYHQFVKLVFGSKSRASSIRSFSVQVEVIVAGSSKTMQLWRSENSRSLTPWLYEHVQKHVEAALIFDVCCRSCRPQDNLGTPISPCKTTRGWSGIFGHVHTNRLPMGYHSILHQPSALVSVAPKGTIGGGCPRGARGPNKSDMVRWVRHPVKRLNWYETGKIW